jgi:mercuric ion transport protein
MAVPHVALLYQFPQHPLHGREVSNLLLDQTQLASGQRLSLAAGARHIQGQQCGHLIEREAERLCPLDESHTLGLLRRIAPMPTEWLGRLIQQAAPLVVANRLDIHTGSVSQLADGQYCFHHTPLDSVLKYGIYSNSWANRFKENDMARLTEKSSLIASVLAAIGASVCCVGPLVLLALGIGGSWVGSLTAMEPYRPFFIGMTLLFLGLAFRKLYLVPQVCTPGTPCADPRTRQRQRLTFWIVTVLLLGLLAVPWFAPLFY